MVVRLSLRMPLGTGGSVQCYHAQGCQDEESVGLCETSFLSHETNSLDEYWCLPSLDPDPKVSAESLSMKDEQTVF